MSSSRSARCTCIGRTENAKEENVIIDWWGKARRRSSSWAVCILVSVTRFDVGAKRNIEYIRAEKAICTSVVVWQLQEVYSKGARLFVTSRVSNTYWSDLMK